MDNSNPWAFMLFKTAGISLHLEAAISSGLLTFRQWWPEMERPSLAAKIRGPLGGWLFLLELSKMVKFLYWEKRHIPFFKLRGIARDSCTLGWVKFQFFTNFDILAVLLDTLWSGKAISISEQIWILVKKDTLGSPWKHLFSKNSIDLKTNTKIQYFSTLWTYSFVIEEFYAVSKIPGEQIWSNHSCLNINYCIF